MATLLVIGGSGLLGSKLASAAIGEYDVVATYRSIVPQIEGVNLVELHKERREEAQAAVRRADPDFVVDTAAFHDVDKCEVDKDLAWKINAASTHTLARLAKDLGARYLYVSTDFVFDGTAGPYKEADIPGPVNYYALTKLLGEQAVLGVDPENQVVRPSVIYGWDDTRLNFATWVLTSLREGKDINVVMDWHGSPTLADSLAEAILKLLKVKEGGIFHLAGPDCMIRFEFAGRLAKAFGLDRNLIRPVTASELGLKAERPPNSCLINERAAVYGISTASVEEGIKIMRSQQSLEDFETPERFKS